MSRSSAGDELPLESPDPGFLGLAMCIKKSLFLFVEFAGGGIMAKVAFLAGLNSSSYGAALLGFPGLKS